METRRSFLQNAAIGIAAGASSVGLGAAGLGSIGSAGAAPPTEAAPETPAPWPLFAPLTAGAEIGLGWRLARVFPVANGAITVNLWHGSGHAARIDLCRRDGAARGPAATSTLDFIVMDGGSGDSPLAESLGRAVRRLAAIVGENEGNTVTSLLPSLMPHAERVVTHAAALSLASVSLAPTA